MTTAIFRKLRIAALVSSLAAIATFALAHEPWLARRGPANPGEPAASSLNAEQLQELEQARGAYREQALPLQTELDSMWAQLDALMSRPNVDTEEVLTLRRQIRRLEGELDDLEYEASVRFRRMLSPEQMNDFGSTADLLAGHRGWSCDAGCTWHGQSSPRRWLTSRNWDDRHDYANHGHCW